MSITFKFDKNFEKFRKDVDEKVLDIIREEWLTAIADQLLANVREEITSGKFETLAGTPIYGFFDTGRFGASFGHAYDGGNRIEIGSTSKEPDPLLVEYGHAPPDTKTVTDEEIIKWVERKQIARGNNAVALGKIFAEFIRNNGISPRPIMRTGMSKTISQNSEIARATARKIRKMMKP